MSEIKKDAQKKFQEKLEWMLENAIAKGETAHASMYRRILDRELKIFKEQEEE